jgi:hypothetical protein
MAEASSNNIINNIVVADSAELANPNLSDIIVLKPKSLEFLLSDAEPLKPLPPDPMPDVYYEVRHQPKCKLCNSPFRERAEHVYLASAKRPQAVVNFFLEFFNTKVTHGCVDVHMNNHCAFHEIKKRGLDTIDQRTEDLFKYQFREKEIVSKGLLILIDEIQGVECDRNPELAFKKVAALDKIYGRLLAIQKERDELGMQILDVFNILEEIYNAMPSEETRLIVWDKIQDVKQQLLSSDD